MGQAPLSPYGNVMDQVMRRRGIRSVAALSRYLTESGLEKGVAQQTLSYHFLGRTQPKPMLVEAILDKLDATPEERWEVRGAFFHTNWGYDG